MYSNTLQHTATHCNTLQAHCKPTANPLQTNMSMQRATSHAQVSEAFSNFASVRARLVSSILVLLRANGMTFKRQWARRRGHAHGYLVLRADPAPQTHCKHTATNRHICFRCYFHAENNYSSCSSSSSIFSAYTGLLPRLQRLWPISRRASLDQNKKK